MPIAPPIASCWPSNVFDEAQNEDPTACWSAFQVRPRCEKSVSRELRKLDTVGYFLPYAEETRTYQRRQVTVQNLLFPGYVFAFGTSDDVRSCRYTVRGIINHLQDPDQASLYGSLATIKKLIDEGTEVTTEQKLKPGMDVEIVSGPLNGLRGKVIRNSRGLRFLVQLNFIQEAASVAVDGSMVKAV